MTTPSSPQTPHSDRVPRLACGSITKAYPGVVANDGIDLTLFGGEVHCLLGENAAGKSTLVSVLAGLVRPDAGHIEVDGRLVQLQSPGDATRLGVAVVPQHDTLVPVFTVLENLLLGRSAWRLPRRASAEGLARLSSNLGLKIEADEPVSRLSAAQRQQVELVKALMTEPRVLMLDEPTALLSAEAVGQLRQVLSVLRERGVAVLLITHKVHEALDTADRITVLRKGRVAGGVTPAELQSRPRDQLVREVVSAMFPGDPLVAEQVAELRDEGEGAAGVPQPAGSTDSARTGTPLIELEGISAASDGDAPLAGLDLSVWPGELVGVAGLDGDGQRTLAEAIAGQRRLKAGEIRLAGEPVGECGVEDRFALGLRYVTDERLGEGLVPDMGMTTNLLLKRIGRSPYWRRGRLRRDAASELARDAASAYSVTVANVEAPVSRLSGGNLQKVVLARELADGARVVVFSKPTYGLDARTTLAVRARMRELAAAGGAGLLISPDLEELLDLCDRVLVLRAGRAVGVVTNGPGAAGQIGRLMAGVPA
jgi:general nucleoside transport system ATP-binding protein